MPGRTPEGDALTELVLPVLELGGELLAAAAMMTAHHELTPARWRVLGAVLEEPLSVAQIARRVGLGLSRQSVQRVANDVVAQGWATWQPNPARRGQNLLVLTGRGHEALKALATEQHAWADAVGAEVGEADLRLVLHLARQVTAAARRYRESGGAVPAGPS
ncbi:MarR family winged helix-turn-helix transcriptional regulator [Actinomyces wuliandei]|uniref:MarR family winged helix-turn-helix transcriptional regulator n=1 Tax=Actinomyces wuliandei TaxID=2057743 RepID=UPI000FDBBEC5|nr:MarR family winged helix-turn-helix transcriptional regulator [Actinomyces wuliandei]